MDADPGQVIRSLRLALEMSQAEFARAAGWSPSTISSWERGRAKPSRLAFKTILAFAEERGVRYRPRSPATTALVPMATAPRLEGPYDGSPPHADRAYAGVPGPRATLRPLVYPERPSAAHANAQTWGREAAAAPGPPPRWSAEASFRVTLGARSARDRGLPRGVVEGAIVVAAFVAALSLRTPVRRVLGYDAVAATAAARYAADPRDPVAAPAPVLASVGSAAGSRRTVTTAPDDDVVPPAHAQEQPPIVPRPVARLESVMAIGDAARATFRTANDAVTVERGEWLGGLEVAAIASDGVTLVDRAGTTRRVRVGQHTPLD